MAQKLHIDIETYSSVDISSAGAYKYFESLDFEILMIAYAIEDNPVKIVDLVQVSGKYPMELAKALTDPTIEKWAHNAAFERGAFAAYGLEIPAEQWHCTAVKAATCGLPISLDQVSKALDLGDKAKSAEGKALINYFSKPCKPTKINGMRTRNLPHHNPEKWQKFLDYCCQDVEAEREIDNRLAAYDIIPTERELYILDQKINDRGVLIDTAMVRNAIDIDLRFAAEAVQRCIDLTGVQNPNSPAQLKEWLSNELQTDIPSLAKGPLADLLKETAPGAASEVMKLRQLLSKTSTKKYVAMLKAYCEDDRIRGMLQFYGAGRTGRWAGRIVQPHNLKKNNMPDLDLARSVIASGNYELTDMLYGDLIPDTLSQLIRTALIAGEGKTFAVADFSAIEGRVIAWLADEKWRLNVFNGHGKIYEASASKMFNIPIELCGKGTKWRDLGKVAELALGFQGAAGALSVMDYDNLLSETQKPDIVRKWRKASPAIVQLWYDIEGCAIRAVKTRKLIKSIHKGLEFEYDGVALTVKLPSGRKLFYWNPSLRPNSFDKESLVYWGTNPDTKQWGLVETYGGKLVENIVQAIARDCLAHGLLAADLWGFSIDLHVHDEIVANVDENDQTEMDLDVLCGLLGKPIPWAPGLPLKAEGYLTKFYKKD